MKKRAINLLRTYPLFPFLLPVFFVFHGFTEYYNLVPVKDSLFLAGTYLIATLILLGASWILFRNIYKASIFVFFALAFNFFFGGIHDFLKANFPGLFISRYAALIIGSVILFLVLLIILKKRKKTYYKFTQYLNYLLVLLLLFDVGKLFYQLSTYKQQNVTFSTDLSSCNDCNKPDIYLILTDGYAGRQSLSEIFNYDNSLFEAELIRRGFHINSNSSGNYNFTPFAMASFLNLNYLTGIEGRKNSKKDMRICYGTIRKNKTFEYLKKEGYNLYNYSIFNVDGQPSVTTPTFLQAKTKPITSQTFLYRIQRDLWFHLVTDLHLKFAKDAIVYRDFRNNEKIYSLTKKIASTKTVNPKLVYSHFVYPHSPYYFDSTGKEVKYEMLQREEFRTDKKAYISYLKYCNKELLKLIDYIITTSPRPPIILLMSDHGFREFTNPVDKKYHFMNLSTVLLPDKNYSKFYNGMTNVNMFRVLLNSEFKQTLPMLKDSVSFLRE